MTTTPQIERMAEAIHNAVDRNIALDANGKPILYNSKGVAQAAYDASDARLVPMLVEALKNIQGNVYFGMSEDTGNFERSPNWNYIYKQTKQALAALPKEYKAI